MYKLDYKLHMGSCGLCKILNSVTFVDFKDFAVGVAIFSDMNKDKDMDVDRESISQGM